MDHSPARFQPRRLLSTAAGALAVALLVGCSSTSTSESSSGDGGAGSGADAPGAAAPGNPGSAAADPDRQVVTTATAVVAVEDPAEAAQRISELVGAAGGRVDERTEQAGSREGEGTAADLVVRVPADALTGVLADLDDLGDVVSVSVARRDVTTSAVDLDAQISALRTSAARLQALMKEAATTDALLGAEKALSERQKELESLQAQRTLLADQVQLSTLSVHLAPLGVATPGGPDGFLDGLGTGWRSLVSALGSAVVVLGVLLPWVTLAAVVAAAVLVPLRTVRRRAGLRTASPPASEG